MMRVWRLALWCLAVNGFLVTATMMLLWLLALPILSEARAQYEALPLEMQCRRAPLARPPHYPSGARELESVTSAERSVYTTACYGADMPRECAYMSGAARNLGYLAFRRLHLSDCEVLALSFHGETPLGHARAELYPDRRPATLSEAEQSCLVARTRYSSIRHFCARNPSCCASTMQDG
jgi:hypothetical protein